MICATLSEWNKDHLKKNIPFFIITVIFIGVADIVYGLVSAVMHKSLDYSVAVLFVGVKSRAPRK